ncbi:hypothetical protein [Candidatus Tisiphia endosymbiont of Beris chalybata]|uniref:hypothetical protein n=1 Tax=Candidatus Tisiphia endosymbiont of Beris chalybata TaxID=3066262 RepID=UPI00312C8123
MLKALLVEWLRPYIIEEQESYTKRAVYVLNVIGVVLLIAANYVYFYFPDNSNLITLMSGGTLSVLIAMFIESLRCYSRYKNKYKTFNAIKASGQEVVEAATTKMSHLIPWGKLVNYLPVIVRIVPTSVLTFIIYKVIKRAMLTNFSKK